MTRKIITSSHAPEPIGPYSQAIQFGNLLFTSGQIAIDPNTSELILGNIAEQTKQVLKNLAAVLAAGGASPDTVLKTTIYLKNMGDFSVVNEIYSQFFAKALPARSTVEVNRLPKDVLVEIDCIACVE
jgi:2-iminobutanoate/2-iminopropanoate deaminase